MARNIDSLKYQKELKQIQQNIQGAYEYFRDNYEKFKRMYHFICVSNLSLDDTQALAALGKPTLAFNVLEAFISKLRAIFLEQEPTINVKPAVGLIPQQMSQPYLDTLDILEAHLREAFQGPDSDRHRYQIISDILIGGWGVGRLSTDYASSNSFEQNFTIDSRYPPDCIFDPSAKEVHKGDGQWCAENIAMTEDEFTLEFGEEAARNISFTRKPEGFQWSYTTPKGIKVANVVKYYKKEKKKKKIVKLSTGKTMDAEKYPQFLLEWDMVGIMEQPPQIVDERMTIKERICLYTICEGKVLDYEETDFEQLPLVFYDGNSVMAEDPVNNQLKQVCRSYVWNAIDAQRVKNFAGQCLAEELQNMVMHKIMLSTQAIPEDKEYQRALTQLQKPNTIVWNEFWKGDPQARVSPPQMIQRAQTPPVIMEAFSIMDKQIQMSLGDYDTQIAQQSASMSGKAYEASSAQTNMSAKPWFIGFIAGEERMAQGMVTLIPKIWKTPRSIPIRLPTGERDYKIVNDQQSPSAIMMDYDPESMMVRIEPGPSIGTQKKLAMQQITEVMKISPIINEYFSTDGAMILMDQVDYEGSDRAKAGFTPFLEQKKQSMAQQSQMQQQGAQIAMKKLMNESGAIQAKAQATMMDAQTNAQKVNSQESQFMAEYIQTDQKNDREFKLSIADVALRNKEADAEMLVAQSKLQTESVDQLLKAEQIDAENTRTQIDGVVQLADHLHTREMDLKGLENEKSESKNEVSEA